MAVFFDATGTTATSTTIPFHDIEYRWDFNDPGSGNWGNGSRAGTSSRNVATGPLAAHVFETPGTYNVTLTVTDGTNTATGCSASITVLDPDAVFAEPNTICFSTTGDFTGAPPGSCLTPGVTQITDPTGNFTAAISNQGTGKRLLFKSGETFFTAGTQNITVPGPGTVGSYGGGSATIRRTTDGEIIRFENTDWRVMDLILDGNNFPSARGVANKIGSSKSTVLRITAFGHEQSISGTGDQVMIADSSLGVASTDPTVVGYGCFCSTSAGGGYFAFMGNSVNNLTGGTPETGVHALRTVQFIKYILSNNSITSGKFTGLDLQAPAFTGANFTEQLVISDNRFIASTTSAAFGVGASQGNDGRVRNVLAERNWFDMNTTPVAVTAFQMLPATDSTFRNNVMTHAGTNRAVMLVVNVSAPAFTLSDIRAYNNSAFTSTASFFSLVRIASALASNVTIRNNLAHAPNAVNNFSLAAGFPTIVDDIGATNTLASGNSDSITPNQVKTTAPSLNNATPSIPAHFGLSGGSYALNAGVSVPVFSDFFRISRPVGAIDIGATEQ